MDAGAHKRPIAIIAAALLLAASFVIFMSSAPGSFPAGAVVKVAPGTGLSAAASAMKDAGVIRSAILFRIYATILGGSTGVKAGEYLFDAPQSAVRAAERLTHGEEGFPLVKVTIPEGSDSADMAAILKKAIPGFDSILFLSIARGEEGYLFPDTYFWPVNAAPARVAADMRAEFNAKIASITPDLGAFGKQLKDVIAMASLIEKEATSTADRRLIAGILWKRLGAGMPLQTDASFYYVLGSTTRALTLDDLRMSSPYNLYTHAGLPPSPIGSPGLDAILDTIHPTASRYWYYLTGTKGGTYYAATLDEHNANKARYLK